MFAKMNKKKVTNSSYIHGDFDTDGIANIDDKKPFNSRISEPVNKEVSLSKTIKYVETKRAQANMILDNYLKEHPNYKGRVKDTYSIINKQVRRNPSITNDLIGIRYEAEKRKQALKEFKKFNNDNRVPKEKVVFTEKIGKDNKYRSLAKSKNHYRAYHSNIITPGGFGLEAQFRTKEHGKLNDAMHEYYKKGEKIPHHIKRKAIHLRKKGY